MSTLSIATEPRPSVGGSFASRLRRQGKLPAVVYGHAFPARAIAVPAAAFARIHRTAGESTIVELTVVGAPSVPALIQDVAYDPRTGAPIHVDFRAISMTEKVTTHITLAFTGVPPIVASGGGVLVKQLDRLEVSALPGDLVHAIPVDCGTLAAVGNAIHVRDLSVPAGITVRNNPETVVAMITEIAKEEVAPVVERTVADVAVEEKGKTEDAALDAKPAKDVKEEVKKGKEKK